jgi:energy-coupling factor transporter ATP-binding protein EcfA2
MINIVAESFPRELLNKSNAERLEYFRGFTIRHPLLLKAYEDLRCAVRDCNPGSIIFLQGPTGVGKTTLLKRLEKHLKEIMLPELEKDPERIPVVTFQLDPPTSGNFDWKEYFKWLLIELEEPLVDDKLDMDRWKEPPFSRNKYSKSNVELITSDQSGARPMRFAAQQTLLRRRPLAVLLDDAQYFGIISSGRKLLDQLNIIKSLASKSLTTHVLGGTYELIPLRNLNGQLSRRSIDIHFGRYHAKNNVHRQEFINVLDTFQKHLPLAKTPDLVSKWDYFYERSLGCVGVLKDWLTSSLALALDNGSSTLRSDFLKDRALSVTQCKTMLSEATLGEEDLKETEGDRLQLRVNLGLDGELSKVEQERPSRTATSEQTLKAKPRKSKHRIGTRKPVRDKIRAKIA